MRTQFTGIAHQTAEFLQAQHLCNADLWAKFVDIFRSQPDSNNKGWRGEYWGKMMRGAVLVYQYTQNDTLYDVLTNSVKDMISTASDDGRVSSYSRDTEFQAWDIWSRKYVILACEYYLEICKDDSFKAETLRFISRCADYILSHIGADKLSITRASNFWLGLNSSSILEPMVRLYRLTGDKRYLDFSSYIVELGGAEGVNIFELAYENRIYPYQYGVSKAYEMTSCFEGLLEYYEVTGIEKYKTAVLNYAKALLDSEISIIGCSGITHELFDHTKTRQTVTYVNDEVMQETCVTVTLMKFFARILFHTDDSVFADVIEKSFYNAYLGALNTEGCECKFVHNANPDLVDTNLPFDSYSPLTPGKRGKRVGGFQILPDRSYYGCCACIGAAGVGIFIQNAVNLKDDCVTVNFYESGKAHFELGGIPVTLEMLTRYPVDGKIKINICAEKPVNFTLKLRTPQWADAPHGYTVYSKVWQKDSIELDFDMPIKLHFPEYWQEDTVYIDMSKPVNTYYAASPVKVLHKAQEDNYVAVTRGPLTLAADSRTGKSADSVFDVPHSGVLCENSITKDVPCLLKMKFEGKDGESFYLVDYAHAGRDWETVIAAWLPTK